MQYHAIPCNTMHYHAIPCIKMQYHAIQCNTMQCHAITCNTMQYHAIPCNTINTMHRHTLLITADGAYHCPVGSIWPFLKVTSDFACPGVFREHATSVHDRNESVFMLTTQYRQRLPWSLVLVLAKFETKDQQIRSILLTSMNRVTSLHYPPIVIY